MESLNTASCLIDDLLDFASDIGDEYDVALHNNTALVPPPSGVSDPGAPTRSFSEMAEEELEWISNKDAFPSLETFVDIPSEHHREGDGIFSKQHSPLSVLENATTSSASNSGGGGVIKNYPGLLHVPVKARSKSHRRRRRDIQVEWRREKNTRSAKPASAVGRKCEHCGAEKTPQWRAGPTGLKTLCNACGVRYKSGRLVPEYRPASSPSFCSELHSNSHRKVLEMRKQKQLKGLL